MFNTALPCWRVGDEFLASNLSKFCIRANATVEDDEDAPFNGASVVEPV